MTTENLNIPMFNTLEPLRFLDSEDLILTTILGPYLDHLSKFATTCFTYLDEVPLKPTELTDRWTARVTAKT